MLKCIIALSFNYNTKYSSLTIILPQQLYPIFSINFSLNYENSWENYLVISFLMCMFFETKIDNVFLYQIYAISYKL